VLRNRKITVLTIPVLASTFLVAILAAAQAAPEAQRTQAPPPQAEALSPNQPQPLSDQDIQMLRKNLRSERKQVIAANMKLSDAEAEKFWPVYDHYVGELVALNNKKYDLIKQYVQGNGTLTDAQAETAVTGWIGVDQAVGTLRLKYVPIFRKVLSAKNTALFYQLDRRIQLMIDLQLASALPLIEP
jgi:hypothetical protein